MITDGLSPQTPPLSLSIRQLSTQHPLRAKGEFRTSSLTGYNHRLLPSPLREIGRGILLLFLVFLGCQPADQSPTELRDFRLPGTPLSVGGDFTLTDHNNQPFTLSNQSGPFLLFFGYANCPDVCPQTLSKISQVYAQLGDDAKYLKTLFISVDPDRDPPETLKTYLDYFNMPVIGLTGPKATIDKTVKQYGGFYQVSDQNSAAGYLIDHSVYIYLIDKNGDVRFLFRSKDTPQNIADVVRQLK